MYRVSFQLRQLSNLDKSLLLLKTPSKLLFFSLDCLDKIAKIEYFLVVSSVFCLKAAIQGKETSEKSQGKEKEQD